MTIGREEYYNFLSLMASREKTPRELNILSRYYILLRGNKN